MADDEWTWNDRPEAFWRRDKDDRVTASKASQLRLLSLERVSALLGLAIYSTRDPVQLGLSRTVPKIHHQKRKHIFPNQTANCEV